jgi:hypothetical protein
MIAGDQKPNSPLAGAGPSIDVSGLQCGHRAAGLDEIRGSAPDYQVELAALWFSRVLPTHGPTVVPSRRRSPSQLVEACHPSDTGRDGLLSGVCAQNGSSRGTIGFAAAQHRPDDPRQLVGHRRHDHVERPAGEKLVDPCPGLAVAALRHPTSDRAPCISCRRR